jgi:hypothetical protein
MNEILNIQNSRVWGTESPDFHQDVQLYPKKCRVCVSPPPLLLWAGYFWSTMWTPNIMGHLYKRSNGSWTQENIFLTGQIKAKHYKHSPEDFKRFLLPHSHFELLRGWLELWLSRTPYSLYSNYCDYILAAFLKARSTAVVSKYFRCGKAYFYRHRKCWYWRFQTGRAKFPSAHCVGEWEYIGCYIKRF